MNRRRIKRTLVNEVVSDGSALPLDGATGGDGSMAFSPTRHDSSDGNATSLSIGSCVDLPDENYYCSMPGTTNNRTDFHGGSLLQESRENTDVRGRPFVVHDRSAMERRGCSMASPAILTDKTFSLRRTTTGYGDVRQQRFGDREYGKITAESSQPFVKHVPFRKTLTIPVLTQKRPDIDSVDDDEQYSGKATVARRPVDTDTDEMTFFYPNQVLLQKRDEINTTKHCSPSSRSTDQTVKRKAGQEEVAYAESSPTSSEQMVEHEYITIDMFGKPDCVARDLSDENTAEFEVQYTGANTDNAPISNYRNVQRDNEWLNNNDTTRLPANYPVENTMSTRL